MDWDQVTWAATIFFIAAVAVLGGLQCQAKNIEAYKACLAAPGATPAQCDSWRLK